MFNFFKKLYKGTLSEFWELTGQNLKNSQKMFVVTANPEIFSLANKEQNVRNMLMDDDTTIIADGIGVVKGAGMLGISVAERIPGVELAEHLLKTGNSLQKSIFLFGAKRDILDLLCEKIKEKYPKLNIIGSCDGYADDKDAVFEQIKELKPDIVLVALGVPAQEMLIYKHIKDFSKGIFVGVGGSFDVLSGAKQRAPEFFIKHNLEWFYRILKEPKRIKRFYNNNVKFLFEVKKIAADFPQDRM